MATKYVGIRLEEELLKLKPENMTLSDWIRECIHVWRMTKEGQLKELFQKVEELTQAGKELRKCPNIESLKKVADEIEKSIKALSEYKQIIENLEWYKKQLRSLSKELQEKLIYRPNLYQRTNTYENDEWE